MGEAFEDVFKRVLPRAIRVAWRILGNETQAEDAAAEALARAHASWNKIASTPYCDAWILRVTANVAVDMHRSRRRLSWMGLSVGADRTGPKNEPEATLAGLTLAAALQRLPRRQREIVVLRYLEGLSEGEVATALNVSVGTVKKNGFRARETLRGLLGTEFET